MQNPHTHIAILLLCVFCNAQSPDQFFNCDRNSDPPDAYDIVINELMADPSPPVGQPNAEYVELYNTGTQSYQLENYTLTVGTKTVLLPPYSLEAGGYVLVVDNGDSALFPDLQNILEVKLPALTNTGTTLELADDLGNTLHTLSYDLDSYQDPSRDNGGWSLELIDPFAPCRLKGNLHVSQDLTGGTPGRVNSVLDSTPDTTGPALQGVAVTDSTTILCTFDEIISHEGYHISLDPDQFVSGFQVFSNIIALTLQSPLQSGIAYTLSVHHIEDCIGNSSTDQAAVIGLPEIPHTGELVINELLFDPATGGSRFIEILNTSSKFLDLSTLVIAEIEGDTIAAFTVETPFLLTPYGIAAITPDAGDLVMQYPMHDAAQIIENSIPTFNRTAGNVTVYTRQGEVLDAFDYSASMHNPLLHDTKGVSLERISASLPSNDAATWHSAAASAEYGTPGLPNSEVLPGYNGDDVVEIQPEVFSPDGDGFDDFLTVRFTAPDPGTLASIRVFDVQGREIARLASNRSIGQNTVFRWDGNDGTGRRARIGPYVIWTELFRADGTVRHFKRTCVLAEHL